MYAPNSWNSIHSKSITVQHSFRPPYNMDSVIGNSINASPYKPSLHQSRPDVFTASSFSLPS